MRQQQQTVGRRAVRGAAVLTGATYISMALGIVARKVIALYLTPQDVGLYQTALSFVDLIISFAAFSFTSAIINVRDNLVAKPLHNLKENVFILTVSVNGAATLLAMLLGLFSLTKLHGSILIGIIGIYSVQRFISALDTFYTQILERELSYTRISQVTVVTNIVLHAASVAFAVLGGSAWAIPIATILSTILSYILDQRYVRESGLHAFHSHPFRYYDADTAKWLWRFGFRVLFNRVFESWLFKIDNLMVAFYFGSFFLGYYSQAFSIALLPATAVAPVVARVSIATYAEIQHDRATLTRAFSVTNFWLVRLLVPASIFVMLESKDLVRVFLSSNWGAVAAPLSALGGLVLCVPLFENAKMILGATLRLREISIVRGAQLAVLILLLFLVGHMGILVVALCVSFVSILGYLFILQFAKRAVDLNFRENFALPLLMGLAVLLVVYFGFEPGISRALPEASSLGTAIARLCIYGTLILGLCVALEYPLRPHLYKAQYELVKAKLSRS